MSSPLVDFHCHLDLYPDHIGAVEDCERSQVFTLAVTTTPKAWARNYSIASKTKYVKVALGLHPQLVAQRAGEIGLWDELLPEARYIGEVGLDAGPQFYKSIEEQKRVFAHILSSCARTGNKILSVHSVRASKTVLDLIEKHMPPPLGSVVLHWFTGTTSDAKRALDLGCYFSVNAKMLASEKSRNIVKSLPVTRLLTETDGPFTRTGNRASIPTDVHLAIEMLAKFFRMPPDQMRQTVHANLAQLLPEQF